MTTFHSIARQPGRATARDLRSIGSLLVVSILLASCGGSEQASDATSTSSPEAQSQQGTQAEEAFPVTIEHKHGSTVIPAEPKRVVSLGFNEHDFILALGVKPVAVRYWVGDESDVIFPWAEEAFAAAQGPESEPEIFNFSSSEMNFEAIAALQPDLISALYAGGLDDGVYEKLSQIAPTIAQSDAYVNYGMPWQEMTKTIGRALGREQQAADLVAEVEERFAAARAQHPQFEGRSLLVTSGAGDEYYPLASEDGRSRPFVQLGFEIPDEIDELAGEEFYAEISAEQVHLFDRDILIYLLDPGQSPEEIFASNPLLEQLEVVKEDRTVFVEGHLNDAHNFGTVLSLPFFLDGIVPMLEAAVDRL